MREPETGATPEQIEAAVRRWWHRHEATSPVPTPYPGATEITTSRARLVARTAVDLVPPGYRIVGPDAVVLSADEAAMLEGAKTGAYRERNRLVAFLTRIFPAWLSEATDATAGWRFVVTVELIWLEPTIYGDMRNQLGPCYAMQRAQASWHIPDDELPMFGHLEVRPNKWDGHTTAEKYQRLDRAGRFMAHVPNVIERALATKLGGES